MKRSEQSWRERCIHKASKEGKTRTPPNAGLPLKRLFIVASCTVKDYSSKFKHISVTNRIISSDRGSIYFLLACSCTGSCSEACGAELQLRSRRVCGLQGNWTFILLCSTQTEEQLLPARLMDQNISQQNLGQSVSCFTHSKNTAEQLSAPQDVPLKPDVCNPSVTQSSV